MPVTPVVPSNLYKFALGKQTAYGTAATNPDYQIPAYSADIGETQELADLELISGIDYLPGQYKTRAGFGGDIVFASHPDSTPRVLAAHFGTASDTMTGAGDPRTHTFARKLVDLPHTVWVSRPVAGGTFEHTKGVDVLCSKVTFTYDTGEFFKLDTSWVGASAVGNATAPTPTNTIAIPSGGNFGHTWARATIKLDVNATPATTTITNVTNFAITSAYDSAQFLTTQNLNPDFVDRGRWSLTGEATVLLANWQAYNWTFYGSTSPSANAAQSSSLGSGAIDVLLDQEPTSANRTLQIQVPYFQITQVRPTPNPDGSGITATLNFVVSLPTSGEPITVIDKTAVSTAYS